MGYVFRGSCVWFVSCWGRFLISVMGRVWQCCHCRHSPSFKGFRGGVVGESVIVLFGSDSFGIAGLFGLWCGVDGWRWPGACEFHVAEFLYYLWDG